MAEIINFNKARKLKARRDAEAQAAENRARHGRTQLQKLQDAAAEAESRRRLDLLRLEDPASPPDSPKTG
jgi:hypothetical protein